MKHFSGEKAKRILLSIAALILTLMLTVGITYSWIDDVKQISITTVDNAENTPLKTGVDINSDIEITSTNNSISLGDILAVSDTKFTNSEGKKQLKYEDINNQRKPDWNEIDNKKGYFYESGDMHLSGCYSDGETFYFKTSENNYREGNKDDENVNYISFTTRVSSPDASVDFWFRNVPSITKHGNTTKLSNTRVSINVDGRYNVYSSDGTANTCDSTLTGTQPVTDARQFSKYTYNNAANTTADRGENSNVLFSIPKGSTVNLTVKIWLEGTVDSQITSSDIDVQLVSSWAYKRKIIIEDKTSGAAGKSWIGNDGAKMYLTLPEVLEAMDTNNSGVGEWPNLDNAPFYPLTRVLETDKYEVNNVPLVYNNEKMVVYRCTKNGWNNKKSNAERRSDYQVYCWNWWKSTLPNTYRTETYTLYGCSLDKSAHDAFGTVETDQGYGTWGGVEKISVYSHFSNVDYANKYVNGKTYKLFLRDYTDESTVGIVYTYEMYRSNNNGSNDPWMTYIPTSSTKLQFDYFSNTNSLQGKWGYGSWNNQSPQQRPVANDIYASNATVYHFAGNDNGDGRGYWEGAEYVYLIKNSNMWNADPYANMLNNDTNEYSGNNLMNVLRNATDTEDIKYGTAPVYKSSNTVLHNNNSIYKNVNFNNGYEGGQGDWTVQSNNIVLFPGCFYNFGESKWLGSLTNLGRAAVVSEESGGGESGEESGSIEGYTEESNFKIRITTGTNNVTTSYDVYQNAAGDSFKARINLANETGNWTTILKNGTNYGNVESSQHYSTGLNMGLNLSTSHSNNFDICPSNGTGEYIITFAYNNGNSNEITVQSCLKAS